MKRDYTYARGEKGPDWFNEFLDSFARSSDNTTNDILSIINNKNGETVESMVRSYREQVGLDLIAQDDQELTKTADLKKISIRHNDYNDSNVVDMIKNDELIMAEIDSLCKHSGGHKSVYSLINHLRKFFGSDVVKLYDEELINFLQDKLDSYRVDDIEEFNDVGAIGVDPGTEYNDNLAEYALNNGAKR